MPQKSEMNIYQKLAMIRKQVEVIRKNKEGYGYRYVTDDEILARVTVFMKRYDLSLIPTIVSGTATVEPYTYRKTKLTKAGQAYEENVNEVLVSADMTYTWVNNDNPEERVVVPWVMVGHQSDGSQSFGSGLTYSFRYFLLKFFNIATPNDDPDKFRGKQREAESEADRIVAEQIIQTVDSYIKSYLNHSPDKRDKVVELVTKYVKSGDYFKIQESALAGKLFEDLQNKFPMMKEE